ERLVADREGPEAAGVLPDEAAERHLGAGRIVTGLVVVHRHVRVVPQHGAQVWAPRTAVVVPRGAEAGAVDERDRGPRRGGELHDEVRCASAGSVAPRTADLAPARPPRTSGADHSDAVPSSG